jgi:hypothetical protein
MGPLMRQKGGWAGPLITTIVVFRHLFRIFSGPYDVSYNLPLHLL